MISDKLGAGNSQKRLVKTLHIKRIHLSIRA